MKHRKILILGTRGIPGNYGGFETFAERLALYLTSTGWDVSVYCQSNAGKEHTRNWNGIELIDIPVSKDGALGSIIFDFKATLHAMNQSGIILLLGYNTAVFSIFWFLKKRVVLTNMDGMEWWRRKWTLLEKFWLILNERCARLFSTHLIADHPGIRMHFLERGVPSDKITCIPYGSEPVLKADAHYLDAYDLEPNQYAIVIARPEPENSILEVVAAFAEKSRGYKLVVLGKYLPESNSYHKEVLNAARNSDEVVFLGAIYDAQIVQALRYHARLYVHGHTVGGTNPSLVEALAAGMPVLGHYNRFNFWVAGSDSEYFYDQKDCSLQLERIMGNDKRLRAMRQSSLERYQKLFSNNRDVKAYEQLLLMYVKSLRTDKKSDREPVEESPVPTLKS